MRQILCDRCGKIISQDQEQVGYVAVHKKDLKTGTWIMEANPYETWDLCDECIESIHKFLHQKERKTTATVQVNLAPLENKVKTKTASKPKTKPAAVPRPKPKFDAEKAQALRNAGWSILKIAQEMDVSEPTVMKHTSPPEPKKKYANEWNENEPDLNQVMSR